MGCRVYGIRLQENSTVFLLVYIYALFTTSLFSYEYIYMPSLLLALLLLLLHRYKTTRTQHIYEAKRKQHTLTSMWFRMWRMGYGVWGVGCGVWGIGIGV